MPASVLAVRGSLAYFVDDPFLTDPRTAFVHEADGLLLCRDGIIEAVGPARRLQETLPPGVEPVSYPGGLIVPGFIDTHVHFAQTEIIGASGERLLDWLETRAFPAERRFADRAHAEAMARRFCDELLRNGTTTALVFCAVYPQSVDALFAEAARRNLRLAAGKVLMDRNAPADLLDTAQTGYDDSKALIAKWHGKGRALYAITPRFAPTSTPAQLEAAGALWREHPDVLMQTHVAESVDEVAWVRRLFAERANYLDVYDHYGLVGPRAVLAHAIHLSEPELARCHDAGAALAHCPTSNLFLGSGLFRVHRAKDPRRPVQVGLGSDVGAGTSFSALATLNEAYKVARLCGDTLTALGGFFLATLGGARAMGLDHRIGSFAPGREADFIVLDPAATPLLALRTGAAQSIEDLLFALMTLGDDRAVQATYVAGSLAHRRK
jgi:guanine deaminase